MTINKNTVSKSTAKKGAVDKRATNKNTADKNISNKASANKVTADKNTVNTAKKRTADKNATNKNTADKNAARKKGKYIEGVLQGHPRGFAFLISEGNDDIFIPNQNLNGGLHSDTVLVKVLDELKGEGAVAEILHRGTNKIVGTFRKNSGYGFVVPDDKRFFSDIYIPEQEAKKARSGAKVVAAITGYPENSKNPEGIIIEVLGAPGDAGVDILSIIRAHNLTESFDAAVLSEAGRVPKEVHENDINGREDFRGDLVITIDGEDAKDLDDAVSVKVADGGYILSVHIADVTHYVKGHSVLDKEAFNRATSVYFPDRVLPMLPKELSNGICSLNGGVDRLVLSCIMKINNNGSVTDSRICEGVIRTAERMTYTDCNLILAGNEEKCGQYKHLLPMLNNMRKLSEILTAKRFNRGAIDFDLPEAKIILDEKGRVAEVKAYERGISNRIIEEFMLAANECVAEFAMSFEGLPFVYRVHEEPSPEKIEILTEFLDGLGVRIRGSRTKMPPKDLQRILENIKNAEYYQVASKVMLRSMQKARYHYQCLGHYGLAAEFYCHFTSPIRRYPDLAIHRILKYLLKNGTQGIERFEEFVHEASLRSSEKERAAEEAEREVDNLKKAEYMRRFIGEPFSGVISGVTSFGVFAELPNTVEGIIKIENLPADDYYYDERKFRLTGKHHKFALGDKIDIIVAGSSTETRRVEFVLDGKQEREI